MKMFNDKELKHAYLALKIFFHSIILSF